VACRTGCVTKDHASYSECLRGAGVKIAYCNSAGGQDATKQKRWDKELDLYREARAAGVQPAGTKTSQIRKAMEVSEKAGSAFDASTNTFSNGAHYSPKTDTVVKF